MWTYTYMYICVCVCVCGYVYVQVYNLPVMSSRACSLVSTPPFREKDVTSHSGLS